MSTVVLSTLRKHTTGFLVKSVGECCWSRVDGRLLLAVKALYSCSGVRVPVSGVKSQAMGVGLREGRVLLPLFIF